MLSASELDTLPVPRERFRTAARILVVLAAVAALLAPGAESTAQQQSTAVPATDAVLLVKVRQAGLWEMPAGMMAIQKGSSQVVKDVGFALMVDHGRLDVFTRQLAQAMGVALPALPSDEQQGWLREMQAASGPTFDSIFANRLRAAHGAVLAVLAQVRAGTRDERIRAFATTGNQAVLRHITLLESTGMVDYTGLPEANVSTTAAPTGAQLGLDTSQIAVVATLFLLVGGGLFYVLRQIKSNRGRARAVRPAAVRTGGSRG